MAKAPNTIHGKKFERFVHAAFRELYLTVRCKWNRVVDSADAGNVIGKVDSDFTLHVPSELEARPYYFYIECKASINDDTFARNFRSLVKPHQQAKMRICLRGGAAGIYLFESVETETIEVWDARVIVDAWPHKRKALQELPAYTIAKDNFEEFAKFFVTSPAEVYKALQLTRRTKE